MVGRENIHITQHPIDISSAEAPSSMIAATTEQALLAQPLLLAADGFGLPPIRIKRSPITELPISHVLFD
jgi:hypothetical protein